MDVTFETVHGNKAGKHEWLTPPWLIEELGPFDLDPCYSLPHPWETASKYFTEEDDGLAKEWEGFVWCNPPYGENTEEWLKKMSEYKHCIGLIFARTETKMFKKYIWEKAKAVFFVHGRIAFHHSDGAKGGSAGAPSVLVAWDREGIRRLKRLDKGTLVFLNND